MSMMSSLGTLVKDHVEDNKGIAKVVDTKSNITSRSTDPIGTFGFATDTEELLIHTGSGTWVKIATQAIT